MFRIRNSAEKWFSEIAFPVQFDVYYLCLMAGLATGRTAEVEGSDAHDLIDDFPILYRSRRSLIIALFLKTEMEKTGVDVRERTALHSLIERFVSTRSASGLSDEGIREMNRYSFAGFDVLTEWFEDRPRSAEIFLQEYKAKMDEVTGAAQSSGG